jgi:hypothetical protein
MNPLLRLLILCLLIAPATRAQTKVFKAVTADMEQDFQPILQDGKPVGYLLFTQLEKASEDSFNYRIAIMDENLNDIGTVNFRQEKLKLKAVSFEQDVLCLAYVKSNYIGKEYKNQDEFLREKDNNHDAILIHFLGLDGRFKATATINTQAHQACAPVAGSRRRVIGYAAEYNHTIQLKNITGKGFACFYGDEAKNELLVFNSAGKLTWRKQIHENAGSIVMHTSGNEVSLLAKTKDKMVEGGFELLSYNAIDTLTYPKFILKDRSGNSLKVLTFDNDPITGKPYLSGLVIDPKKGNDFQTGREYHRGPYCGVFSITINGHTRSAIQAAFGYWSDGKKTFVNRHGYFNDAHAYAYFNESFKDYQGNTWFAGQRLVRTWNWNGMLSSTLLCWLVVPPIGYTLFSVNKFAFRDELLIKMDPKGNFNVETTVPGQRSTWFHACDSRFLGYDNHLSYSLTNPDTHSNFLILDDMKKIDIYNVSQKKIARTIPHETSDNLTMVLPAKEGYMMVYEFNKKEKTTRLSIEAL